MGVRSWLWERLATVVIARAVKRPYYHLGTYMLRYWLLGHGTARDEPEIQLPPVPFGHVEVKKDGMLRTYDRRASRVVRCNPVAGKLHSWIAENLFAVRVHLIKRSDIERHLHDHPAWNISIVLRGGYYEIMPDSRDEEHAQEVRFRKPGSIVFRRATARHKIELRRGVYAWTIFIIGPTTQKWGFYTPYGKVHNKDYGDGRAYQ